MRSEGKGIGVARFVERALEARGRDVTPVDPLELQLPLPGVLEWFAEALKSAREKGASYE